jgi:hypothetical protein
MVRRGGFEPPWVAPTAPQTVVSASSTISAQKLIFQRGLIIITESLVKASVKQNWCQAKLVGGLGFEPRRAEPESAVLPLHYPPMLSLII